MRFEFIEDTMDVRLTADYVVETSLGHITIPKGFVSDGASIPKALWWYASPYDPGVREAAIIHDYFYRTPNARLISNDCVKEVRVTRAMADDIFLQKLKDGGIRYTKRYAMYWTVRGWNCFTDNWKE